VPVIISIRFEKHPKSHLVRFEPIIIICRQKVVNWKSLTLNYGKVVKHLINVDNGNNKE